MHFARVIGTVVCTEKVPAFRAQRLLLIEPVDARMEHPGRPLVAVDLVSAATGQHVFYVRGREAANALPDVNNPADAAIVGIVDEAREQGPDGRAIERGAGPATGPGGEPRTEAGSTPAAAPVTEHGGHPPRKRRRGGAA